MSAPVIEVEELEVRVEGATLLEGISFAVEAGEYLSVIGPNGAGKSTLMRCLDGLVPASSGTVRIHGTPLAQLPRRHLARLMSYVPQVDARAVHYTARSFVEMGRYPHLGAWEALGPDDVRAVDEALELTETGHLADRSMVSLSGGERQRVVIAAALAQGGGVLLLDEPTTFLDYRHQVQVLALLEHLHGVRGLTVIAVTHDLNGTVGHSDRVLALKGGRMVFCGQPQDLFDCEILREIYGTSFQLVPRGKGELPLVVPRRAVERAQP